MEITISDSEYADDTAFTFDSREECVKMTPLIINHFARQGLEVYVGTKEKESKSEILFYAKDPRCYIDLANYDGTDLSPIKWEGSFQIAGVDKFKYLGSYLSRNCRDDLDINNRIFFAGKAFGSLRKCIFSSCNISTSSKRSVYLSVILSILPYGSECWFVTEKLLD